MITRRFLVGFFAAFLALGGVMLVLGDAKKRERPLPPVVEVTPAQLAHDLIEGLPNLLVVDTAAEPTKLPGLKVAPGADPVKAVEEARGDDKKGYVVLVADASTALETQEIALQRKGFTVRRLRGGAAAWKTEVMESTQPEMAAAAAFFRGELTPRNVDPSPAQPVVVKPRRASGGGGSGC